MTLLGLLIFVPGLEELLTPDVLFSGFSSNAVISIIAVMILGGGQNVVNTRVMVTAFPQQPHTVIEQYCFRVLLSHAGRLDQSVYYCLEISYSFSC